MRSTRESGFTIIELLIAVFISSVVLAGAFGIQAVFNQSVVHEGGVSDLQHTLNAVKGFFRKTLKRAGAGLTSVCSIRSCDGSTLLLPPINVYNNNSFPVVPDNSVGGVDNDPDWITFIAPQNVNVTSVATWVRIKDWGTVTNTTGFFPGQVVAINVASTSCLMRVNTVYNTPSLRYLGWFARGGTFCMNPPDNLHTACGFLAANKKYYPTNTHPVTITSLGEYPFQALRVDNSRPRSPRLMYGQMTQKGGGGGATYNWSVLAEGIEDMQIAYHVDTSPTPDRLGELWVNSRDLQSTEYGRIRSLRFSIVARSSHAMNRIRTRRPGFEDRPPGVLDNYARRKITFVVQLPNMPIRGGALP